MLPCSSCNRHLYRCPICSIYSLYYLTLYEYYLYLNYEHSRHKGTVKINITDNDVYTAVYITNRGDKLSDQRQKQIFERYYSEAKYEDNSMGIGLPLAKAVIEKQGGYISVESDDEKTTFIVKYIK